MDCHFVSTKLKNLTIMAIMSGILYHTIFFVFVQKLLAKNGIILVGFKLYTLLLMLFILSETGTVAVGGVWRDSIYGAVHQSVNNTVSSRSGRYKDATDAIDTLLTWRLVNLRSHMMFRPEFI